MIHPLLPSRPTVGSGITPDWLLLAGFTASREILISEERLYYFYNDGQENVFCASAEWMQRNLNRRVEIMFPIDDENLKKDVIIVLDVQLSDTMRAHIQHDGVYTKDRRGKKKLDCQEYCMEQAVERANKVVEKKTSRVFIPKMKPEEE